MNHIEWVTGGFRLTAPANPTAAVRTGTVFVIGGGISRNFTVSKAAALPDSGNKRKNNKLLHYGYVNHELSLLQISYFPWMKK